MKHWLAILSFFTSLAYAQYTLPSQDIALIVYNKDCFQYVINNGTNIQNLFEISNIKCIFAS